MSPSSLGLSLFSGFCGSQRGVPIMKHHYYYLWLVDSPPCTQVLFCGKLRGLLRGNAINFGYKWDDVTSINRGPLAFSVCCRRHRGCHGDKRAFKKTNYFTEKGWWAKESALHICPVLKEHRGLWRWGCVVSCTSEIMKHIDIRFTSNLKVITAASVFSLTVTILTWTAC